MFSKKKSNKIVSAILVSFTFLVSSLIKRVVASGAAESERGRAGAPEEERARHEQEGGSLQVIRAEHVPRHPRARAGLPLSEGKFAF
jgi:hypothetical protein